MTEAGAEFPRLLVKLRGPRTQKAFAEELGVPRGTLATAEAGSRRPTKQLLEKLLLAFPEHEAAILAAQQAGAPAKFSTETELVLSRTGVLRISGRLSEAADLVANRYLTAEDAEERAVLAEAQGHLLFDLGRGAEAREVFLAAIAEADDAAIPRQANSLRATLARRLLTLNDFALAAQMLEEGLALYPAASELWYRVGTVYWYQHEFVTAYAALTTALQCGANPRPVLHARGQVLAEWGNFQAAYDELTEVLAMPDTYGGDKAFCQSTRAFAIWHLGDQRLAESEFAEAAKETPRNGWLFYFKGRCYSDSDMTGEATHAFREALACESPALNTPKVDYVREWLAAHGQ